MLCYNAEGITRVKTRHAPRAKAKLHATTLPFPTTNPIYNDKPHNHQHPHTHNAPCHNPPPHPPPPPLLLPLRLRRLPGLFSFLPSPSPIIHTLSAPRLSHLRITQSSWHLREPNFRTKTQMYIYSLTLATRTTRHLERKNNITFSRDGGGLKVGVKEPGAEEYSARQQGYLVKAWELSRWRGGKKGQK